MDVPGLARIAPVVCLLALASAGPSLATAPPQTPAISVDQIVGEIRSPDAEASAECSQLECTFEASDSRDLDGSIVSYEWRLGDGTTATGETVDHAYGEEGTYRAHLTVTDEDGREDNESVDVTVRDGSGPPHTLFSDGFEDGDLSEWTLGEEQHNLWRAADDCLQPASGSWQLAFSRPADDCDYDPADERVRGTVTSLTVNASEASTLTLSFDHFWETESSQFELDVMEIHVSDDGGYSWETVAHWNATHENPDDWRSESFDVSEHASEELQIRFSFDSRDGVFNDFLGWYVDDVEIVES